MSKNGNQKSNDQRSNALNPNNPAHKTGQDNKANQGNPNHAPTNPPPKVDSGKKGGKKQP